jgi:2-polyprenyl-6-methoxyphenol hydroxylase-like FAD-dependent oxidoreductase
MLHKKADELLKIVPLAAIVGQLTLSGTQFTNQLSLGHSSYSLINPDLGFITFVGLHDVAADGGSGRFFWMMMRPDPTIADPDHWLQRATKQEKHDHIMKAAEKLEPKFREIFDLTPVEGIKDELHVWKDLEIKELPASRVVLLGDSAHAMTPFRGEGGYHTFLDALEFSETLKIFNTEGTINNIEAVKTGVAAYNAEMLQRGGDSVRFSRASYEEAKKQAVNRKAFLAPMKVLSDKEVVLVTASA